MSSLTTLVQHNTGRPCGWEKKGKGNKKVYKLKMKK